MVKNEVKTFIKEDGTEVEVLFVTEYGGYEVTTIMYCDDKEFLDRLTAGMDKINEDMRDNITRMRAALKEVN